MELQHWIALLGILVTLLGFVAGFGYVLVKVVATFAFKTGEVVTEVQGLRTEVTRAIGEIASHVQSTSNRILEHEERFHPRE